MQTKPRERFFHGACRSPLMCPVKPPQKVRITQFFQILVGAHDLPIIEIVGSDSSEDCEGTIVRRGGLGLESRTIEEHASRAFAELCDARGHARAPGKSCEIYPAIVYRQPRAGILHHGL